MVVKDIIKEMREEIKDLRSDWLTSISEGFCNGRTADTLERYADKLESFLEEKKGQ